MTSAGRLSYSSYRNAAWRNELKLHDSKHGVEFDRYRLDLELQTPPFPLPPSAAALTSFAGNQCSASTMGFGLRFSRGFDEIGGASTGPTKNRMIFPSGTSSRNSRPSLAISNVRLAEKGTTPVNAQQCGARNVRIAGEGRESRILLPNSRPPFALTTGIGRSCTETCEPRMPSKIKARHAIPQARIRAKPSDRQKRC
jgi:hypothetical protein